MCVYICAYSGVTLLELMELEFTLGPYIQASQPFLTTSLPCLHTHIHTHHNPVIALLLAKASPLQGNLTHLERPFSNTEIFPHPLLT